MTLKQKLISIISILIIVLSVPGIAHAQDGITFNYPSDGLCATTGELSATLPAGWTLNVYVNYYKDGGVFASETFLGVGASGAWAATLSYPDKSLWQVYPETSEIGFDVFVDVDVFDASGAKVTYYAYHWYVCCPDVPEGPGTGTPGYWKNHPEAWPVNVIVIGGTAYTREQAIAIMGLPDGDKTITLFRALVAAKLNVMIGCESSCVADTIAAADAWLAMYPASSKVKASSAAWKAGEPLYWILDAYNNGLLCAPHRD